MKVIEYKSSTQKREYKEALRILHAADLHLGRFWNGCNEGKTNGFLHSEKQQGFTAFRNLLVAARDNQVQMLCLAGDILEEGNLSVAEIKYFIAELADLLCPVLIVAGNHDPYSPLSVYAKYDWPDNVHIFASDEWQGLYFPALNTVVWGMSFAVERQSETLLPAGNTLSWLQNAESAESDLNLQLLQQLKAEDNDLVEIGLIHGEVTGDSGKSVYNPLSRTAMAKSGIQYFALGHIHKRHYENAGNNSVWSYPGCLFGNGFDELGSKGAQLVEVSANGISKIKFLPLAEREFKELNLYVEFAENLEPTVNNILAKIAAIDSNYYRNYYRLYLKGELPANLGWQWHLLESTLQAKFSYLKLFNETSPSYDWQKLAEEFSLRGLTVAQALKDIEKAANPEYKAELWQSLYLVMKAFEDQVEYGD